jgi:murein DD-endopeptidase MepM/ murein hydrolase activator NlpD
LLNATVAAQRLLSRLRGDGPDSEPRAEKPLRHGSSLAHRAGATIRAAARLRPGARRAAAAKLASPAARPALTPSALLHRLEAPERLVPILVAGFLLVASITAVPGLTAHARGATEGSGTATRLVVGGDTGPNAGGTIDGSNGPSGGGVDAGLGVDASAADIAAAQQAAAAAGPDVAGQFLADGTLLKPVVVDTTVPDGSSQLRTYTVRSGDTLTGIASRTGVSMMTIWWANHLKSKDALKVGQTLVIPPVDGLVVTVKAGDTLNSIAASEDVNPADIVKINGLTSETLVLGQVLILPGARGDAIATPAPVKPPSVSVATVSRPSSTSHGSGRTSYAAPSQYSGGSFGWPVAGGYISQYFSYFHPALDIAGDYGTGIRAAAAGTVIFAGWKDNGGGYQVWIAHGSGLFTTYNHMSSLATSAGAHVGRGAFIGRMGASGRATGPHLHFEIWRGPVWSGGTRVNPLAYF